MISQKNILQRIDKQLATEVVRKPLTWFWLKILAFSKACVGLLFYLIFLPANAPAASAKAIGNSGKPAKVISKTIRQAKTANQIEEDECLGSSIIRYAKGLLGAPYRAAGKSPHGFDCSGFTGYVFRQFGIGLPSSSKTQAIIGEKISVAAARMGDLAFFGHRTKSGKMVVTHAGIVASDSGHALRVIHSASHKGVTVTSCVTGYWKKNLLFVKRVLQPEEVKVKATELNPNDSWMLSIK